MGLTRNARARHHLIYMSLVQAFWGLSLDDVGVSRRFRWQKIGACWRGPGVDGFEADFLAVKMIVYGILELSTGY